MTYDDKYYRDGENGNVSSSNPRYRYTNNNSRVAKQTQSGSDRRGDYQIRADINGRSRQNADGYDPYSKSSSYRYTTAGDPSQDRRVQYSNPRLNQTGSRYSSQTNVPLAGTKRNTDSSCVRQGGQTRAANLVPPGTNNFRPVSGSYQSSAGSRMQTQRASDFSRGSEAYRYAKLRPQTSSRSKGSHVKAIPFRTAAIIVAVLLCILAVALYLFINPPYIKVEVNGQSVTIKNGSTISTLISEGYASPAPGDLLAVDGTILEAGQGEVFSASVNGGEESSEDTSLKKEDIVTIADGKDITEPANVETIVLESTIVSDGIGAVHYYDRQDAGDGEKLIKTGEISGITVEEVTREPKDIVVTYANLDAGGQKVIALTFDDGPWNTYTTAILDILADNDAKATFFTVGTCVESYPELLQREYEEGHQVCTHTYDHAEGSGQGVSLLLMSVEEQIEEVTKGMATIEKVTGKTASRIIRTPGGNFDNTLAATLEPYIDAEIGWNIDTNDWKRPGSDIIASRILQATSGDIVLMHDGGGDRSQTVEALRQALPQLKAQGYTFVTIDELLELSGITF